MSRSVPLRRILTACAIVVGAIVPAGTLPARAAVTIDANQVVGGLAFPAAFAFTPRGKIFYGEQLTGEIHLYDPTTDTDRRFRTIPRLAVDTEQGLLGLALHPGFPDKPYIYAYATRTVGGVRHNQILRITRSPDRPMQVIFSSSTTAVRNHNGGRILFGPDGMLYAVMGDGASPPNSQDLTNPAGKVLRMRPNGGPPADNPGFAEPRIWSYGLRNSFGFTFDPQTDNLWETENGPECNDEVNVIVEGGNFGWGPNETCTGTSPDNTNQDGPSPILPVIWYTPTIAATGAAFCQGCGLGAASEGELFFGSYNKDSEHAIRRLVLTPDRLDVASGAIVYRHASGIISVEAGPGGALYFSDASGIWKLVTA